MTPKLSFPSTLIADVFASSTLPSKGEAPEIKIPVLPEPSEKGPSTNPSSSVSVAIKSSIILIEPEFVKLRLLPPSRLTPVALSILLMEITPALDKLLSELSVTAGPAVSIVTDPAASIVRSSPFVSCGAVCASEIVI